MSFRRRAELALAICCVTLAVAASAPAESSERSATSAESPRLATSDGMLTARLPSADSAMEYWDVTAWLDSGERFFARFLVTNQGPGERTAAAVGHLVLAGGRTVPFKWGRQRDAWTLGPGGQNLAIGKATLDVSGPAIVVTVDSKKRGLHLRLAIDQHGGPTTIRDLVTPYTFEVAMPATARGTIQAGDASPARTVIGSGAVIHTWTARAEGELLRRRDELLARRGDVALYMSSLTLVDGTRRTTLLTRGLGDEEALGGNATITFGAATTAGGDQRYPLAMTWEGRNADASFKATLDRELLRMNPLDILPQPFRFLLSLGGRPQRVWAAATVTLDVAAADASDSVKGAVLHGIAVGTFARPVD